METKTYFVPRSYMWSVKVVMGGLVEGLPNLCLKAVTCLLGVSQQHGCVGLVENGVIHCSIADTQGPLHHDHLQKSLKKLF